MAALIRLLVLAFVVLSVVYVCLLLYSRSVRRQALIEEWEAEGHRGDRDAFIRQGLEDYRGSLQRKLLLGVYIVPMLAITAIIYLTNFN